METPLELMEHEIRRARVYRILADAFHPPVPKLLKTLKPLAGLLLQLESAAEDIALRLLNAFESTGNIEPLKVDYARLFMGPFLLLAPPYGSLYLEGERRIMGESTEDARNHYLDVNLDIREGFGETPDHVCVELEFLHALIFREVEAIRTDDGDQLTDSLYRQHTFLQNHLCGWIPAFASKMIEHAETEFYRLLGKTTRRFIEEEAATLNIRIPGTKEYPLSQDTRSSSLMLPVVDHVS